MTHPDWFEQWMHGSDNPINHYDGLSRPLSSDEQELAYKWLSEQKSKSQHTFRHSKTTLKQWIEWTDDITNTTQYEWEDWINYLDNSDYGYQTIRTKGYDISGFYRYLSKRGLIDEMPVDPELKELADYEKTQREDNRVREYLNEDECSQLLNSCESVQEEVIVGLLLHTGVRRGEAVEILLREVDRGNRSITVQNGKTAPQESPDDRTVYYPMSYSSALRKWIDNGHRYAKAVSDSQDYLLLNNDGRQMHPDSITETVDRVAERSGLQRVVYEDQRGDERKWIRPHLLRRTFGVHRVRRGMPLPHLQVMMGHESVETTRDRYIKFLEKDRKEAYNDYSPSYKQSESALH